LVCSPRPRRRAPGAQYRQRWNTDGTRIKTAQMSQLFGGLPQHNFRAAAQADKAALYSDWIYLRQVGAFRCGLWPLCLQMLCS
jgi:hypothetical protein